MGLVQVSKPEAWESGTSSALVADAPVVSEKIQSSSSGRLYRPARTEQDAGPPPDGGFRAWLHVACSFLLFFNSWGILSTFATFQTHYESGDFFTASSSNISWIGSIQCFMATVTGFWAGPLYDLGHLRQLLSLGSLCVILGHVALSYCDTYAKVLLAEGFCIGIGSGCLFVCAVSIIPGYFSTKIGLATGITSAGSASGAVIYSMVASKLLDRIGFDWTVRVIGLIALVTLALPVFAMKTRVASSERQTFIDRSAFTDVPYMMFVLGTFFAASSLSVMNTYISFFTESSRLASHDMSFYIVAILNAASLLGRIVLNVASDHLGPLNILVPCSFVTGIVSLCVMAVHSLAGVVVVTIWLGFFSGVFVAMPPVGFASLAQDKGNVGTRIGMGYSMAGLGYLAGAPVAGAILRSSSALDWHRLWLYCGLGSIAAGVIYFAVRVSRVGCSICIKG